MDPEVKVDYQGTGTVTFYALGHSWEAKLDKWIVQYSPQKVSTALPEMNPSAEFITKYAQKLVNRYWADAREV